MAVYAGDLGRKRAGDSKGVAASWVGGFALRILALLVVAAALFAILAAVNVAQPFWLAPVEEQPILIPAPWSGELGA